MDEYIQRMIKSGRARMLDDVTLQINVHPNVIKYINSEVCVNTEEFKELKTYKSKIFKIEELIKESKGENNYASYRYINKIEEVLNGK